MYFSMYWKLKFQISAHLKEKSRKIKKIFYGSQMFAKNTMDRVVEDCLFFLHYIQKFESSDCSMRYDVSFCDLLCVVL